MSDRLKIRKKEKKNKYFQAIKKPSLLGEGFFI
jgi:hypothetical protein